MIVVKKLLIIIAGAALSTCCFGLEAVQAHMENPALEARTADTQDFLVVPPTAPGRPTYSVITGLVTFLATGRETGKQFSLFDITVPPLAGPPSVIQTQQSEALYILDGQLSVLAGNQTILGTPGSFVYFPQGRRHSYQNIGNTAARALLFTTPSGFEGFYQEEGQNQLVTDRSNPPPPLQDFSIIAQIAQKYGSQLALSPEPAELPPGLGNFVIVAPGTPNRPSFMKDGGLYTSLATDEETQGQFSLFDVSLSPQAGSSQLQSNARSSQSFYVLDGDVTFQIGNQTTVGAPGTFIHLPKGTPYAFQNNGTNTAKTLLFTSSVSVPEPSSTLGLLGLGILSAVTRLRQKQKQQTL